MNGKQKISALTQNIIERVANVGNTIAALKLNRKSHINKCLMKRPWSRVARFGPMRSRRDTDWINLA